MSTTATAASGTSTATGEAGGYNAAEQQAGQQGGEQQPAAQTTEQPKPQPPAAQQQGEQQAAEPWNDPAAAKTEIERLRKENGDSRINAKNAAREEGKTEAQTALAKALAPLLGIELPGEQPATPEQLAEQVGNVTSERDAARVDAALARTAWELGVDPSKLDYIAFKLSKSGELDPNADDFAGKLKTSITALVADDATLKRSGTVQASGVENLAGSGGSDTITPEKFANMSLAERSELRKTDQATYDRLVGN